MTHFGRRRRQLRRRFAVEMAARSPVTRAFDAPPPMTPEPAAEPTAEPDVAVEPQADYRRPLPFELSDESQAPVLIDGHTPEMVVAQVLEPVAPVPAAEPMIAEALEAAPLAV